MGIVGNGATPQIADALGGSGGVGIRESFPWVDADAFAVPGAPVMHVPVKVFRLGYGFVNPSVSVCRKATTWFSSRSGMARLPVVLSRWFFTSGIGERVSLSIVAGW